MDTLHTNLLRSFFNSRNNDITASDNNITIITIATAAPALPFFLSSLSPPPLVLVDDVVVVVGDLVGAVVPSNPVLPSH